MTSSPRRRPGYTLLEVLLALTIGVLLLSALYAAVRIQFRLAQSGRDRIERATLARSVLARMQSDISPSLPPYDPTRTQPQSGGQGGGMSGGGNQGGGSPSGSPQGSSPQSGANQAGASQGGSSGGASAAGGSGSSQTTGAVTNLNGPVTFNLGVQGDSTHLTIYVSRTPRELNAALASQADNPPLVSDLRRITYWVASGGSTGLARQEIKIATSDDALNTPAYPDDASYIIAEEVQSIEFQYWDGTTWQDSWDGTDTSGDPNGVLPKGPPLAIAITLTLAVPGSDASSGQPKVKQFRHVVAISAASGATQQTTGNAQQSGSGTSP